jgi:8-oxo-dGTP pyrophosphatase MutT (NUDIX family)
VRVAALVVTDEGVLLVRHRAGDSVYHLLPGGGVDYRETLEDALVREVREETGFVITVDDPIFLSDTIDPRGSRHVVNIVFRARIIGGAPTTAPCDARVEATEVVPVELLSTLDLRPPLADAITSALSDPSPHAVYLGSIFTDATTGHN